jgi:teichuronic acid biosynthesis glycosyltransferase TuaC
VRVLMITAEWPTLQHPEWAPFIVRQAESLRRRGVEVDVCPLEGHRSLGNYARARTRVSRLLAEKRYDLIHAQWAQSALAALPKRLPLVVTFRGSDVEGIVGANGRYTAAGRVLQAISRIVSRLADEAIAVSERLARRLPRRCWVIPSGLDLELFRPAPRAKARARLGLDPEAPLVLFAASPGNPIKRYGLALEAARRAGAGLVVASGVPHALMPVYMSACDALVLTSTHEGSPNVVKEALACDLPVVSVDVGDVSRRIGGVEGCVLCGDDSAATVAAGIARVLARRSRVEGRAAVADLDEDLLAARVCAVYRSALAGRERSAKVEANALQ